MLIRRELDGPIAVLTLRSRPHNLLDPALTVQLTDALRVVTISGARAAVLCRASTNRGVKELPDVAR